MNSDDLQQITIKKDVYDSEARIIKFISESLKKFIPQKEFLSPKEFSVATGIPYGTVVYKCVNGVIKARQESSNCAWQILASEIDRLKAEAENNIG